MNETNCIETATWKLSIQKGTEFRSATNIQFTSTNPQRAEFRRSKSTRHFDPKDVMIQDYMVFLFESDLTFLGSDFVDCVTNRCNSCV